VKVRFEPIGEEIDCAGDETVLDAAFRQGYNLVHGCREGQCSACKCFLLEGEVALKRYSSFALSDSELANGYSLMCRAMPEQDLTIELLHYDPESYRLEHQIREGAATVENVQALTSDITRLLLRAPDFTFTPGQYIDVHVPGGDGAKRSFSMANLPGEGQIELMIKRYPGGKLSALLDGTIKAGDALTFTGPYGALRVRDSERAILMIAGGSGMAPILSLLRQLALEGCERPVRFFYGARTERDLFHGEEIEALGLRDFRFTPVTSRFVHEAVDEYLATEEITQPDVYMCGPPPMIEAAEEMLTGKHKLDEQRIFTDKFTTSADAAAPVQRAPESERDFAWFQPARRRASLYEDVTIDTQPSIHRHLTRSWPVSFEDGRGTWNDDSTALRCTDWFAFRDPGEQWERPFYQAGTAVEHQIEGAMRSGMGAVPARLPPGPGLRRARPVVRDGDGRPRLPVGLGGHLRVPAGGDEAALGPGDRALRHGPRGASRRVSDRHRARVVPRRSGVAADPALPRAPGRDPRLGRGDHRRQRVLRAPRRDAVATRTRDSRGRGQRRHGDPGARARGDAGVGVGARVDDRADALPARG
jgi:propane monooxygenase reductase subunit